MASLPTSYAAVLERFGLAPAIRGPWASIGHTDRLQGWKLHLSSIQSEATALLSVVVPFLSEHGVPFKVAKDETVLSRLNEGEMGHTQVGKFLTIYPRCDDESQAFADALVELTTHFQGPAIPCDLRLGEITYTRYGGFNPIVTSDRLGQIFLCIHAPDGSLCVDSKPVPFSNPDGVSNPFSKRAFGNGNLALHTSVEQPSPQSASTAGKLFGPGYLILEIVSFRPKGSVFRAIDLRNPEQASLKIIKQGRRCCLSDEHGRDIRTRLQHQERLHKELGALLPIPAADPYFEVQGDGYLPLADIEGQTIESFAVSSLRNRPWSRLPSDKQLAFLDYLGQLVSAVKRMHAAGYVHRDLSASNVWFGADGRLYLLDLELTHRVDDPVPPFGLGTLGFMSPAQEARQAPAFADDIYSLGCVMTLLLTGLDPRRVLFATTANRREQLQSLTDGAPLNLIEIIAQCLGENAASRPHLDAIQAAVAQCQSSCVAISSPFVGPSLQRVAHDSSRCQPGTEKGLQDAYARLVRSGQEGLLRDVIMEDDSGLWLSATGTSEKAAAVDGSFRRYHNAHHGVAGVVYLLARLARFGYGTPAAKHRVRAAVKWLLADQDAGEARLPGLYFGEAGVVVAIAEAIAVGLVERDARFDSFMSRALHGHLDWPDITHGAAGQGLAAYHCADRLQDAPLATASQRSAAFLVQTQKADGSWEMPPGVDGMSGETLTGFAHGVSGIVYFLAEYARRTGDNTASKSCQAGIDWLMAQAFPAEDGHALEWRYSDLHRETWKWWCHGSPGIALTFLRMFEHTNDVSYAETAKKALRAHPKDIRYANLSQCHGLAGLGEIYLEAARLFGEPEWYERTRNVAAVLSDLRRETDSGSVTWLVENPYLPTADLMVGSGGVVHFFLRLSTPLNRLGFPLLLDPIR